MSESSATVTPLVRLGRSALHIVLFGMPGAGKSSLLGALAQAAQSQEHILNGHLTDLSAGLGELQRRLYEETQRQTLEEVVPYPVAFEPFARNDERGIMNDERPSASSSSHSSLIVHHSSLPRMEAVLVDCDGRVANDLLARRCSLNSDIHDSTLAQAILDADALILVIDASAPPMQINVEFAEFGRFLHLLEQQRGHRTEIGGLPVFLVLTKCDLLARPGDSAAAWINHIKERQAEVEHRFRDFLAEQAHGLRSVGFGRIDLHPWATSVKKPALTDSPAQPREPFGVAELFRQCLEFANRFRQRRQHSRQRLLWTMTSTAALLLGLGLLATVLIAGRLQDERLEAKVERFQVRDQERSPASWHRTLKMDLDDLNAVVRDPQFDRLPGSKKEFIQKRLQELTAYQQYARRLDQIADPKEARSEAQLKEIEAKLTQLSAPDEYDWHLTEAACRRDHWLEDCQDIKDTVARLKKQYVDLVQKGQEVLAHKNEANLPKRAKELLDLSRTLPDPERDKTRPVRESARVTYGIVFNIGSLEDVYSQWKKVQAELEPFAKLEKP